MLLEVIIIIIISTLILTIFISTPRITYSFPHNSQYVNLKRGYPDTNENRVCRCVPRGSSEEECNVFNMRLVDCGGKKYCCTSNSPQCVMSACYDKI